ncbi:hypothetical protein M422DRAFT_253593 [Sphaerobolus stellatus SS14]|uniref:HNH nuclease domain-containing protein n=1 Tax=Sphaerobolus stellatus (strain SS14) TaxID=990650 RepID=A0A0C9VXE8_SPHS4|nr:hypothetical protein M422DRAFT_253593 [Sphaerobolus stellatus SS14]
MRFPVILSILLLLYNSSPSSAGSSGKKGSKDTSRPRGRPCKEYKPSGRHAASLKYCLQQASDVSEQGVTEAPKIDQRPEKNEKITVPSITPAESLAFQIAFNRPGVRRFKNSLANLQDRLFIPPVCRSSEWVQIASVLTIDITSWFDMQMNDYNAYKHFYTSSTEVRWFGHPNDSPHDVQARQFIVIWRENLVSETIRKAAALEGQIVCRWELVCRGACSVNNREEEDSSEDCPVDEKDETTGTKNQDALEENEDHSQNEQLTRYQRCQHAPGNKPVRLILEVSADDLSVAHIWQWGTHPDANPENLEWSRHLRNEVMSAMHLQGASANDVMKQIVVQYCYPVHPTRPAHTTVDFPSEYAPWRLPRKSQISNILSGSRLRARLHSDPFVAIGILAERNQDKIYL